VGKLDLEHRDRALVDLTLGLRRLGLSAFMREVARRCEQVVEEPAGRAAGQSGEPPEATLAAKRKAEELDVDIWRVEGSGANGRITVMDVLRTANRG
jgi:pyruvate/2-oxoglutarate dehydrogenase complex dihydrolipoamide acyltransferase (E2) component